MIIECRPTPRLMFLILIEMATYLSMNTCIDSLLDWCKLTSATGVLWWGWLVTYCAPKCCANVINELVDLSGRRLYNHVNPGPFREVGKTLHNTTSSLKYRFAWVVNASRYSSGFDMSSYLSMFNVFQVMGRGISIIPSMNRCSLIVSLFRVKDLSLEWTGVSS